MYYDFTLTIPANTTERALKKDTVKLTHGIIHRVEVEFPSGCGGLVHVKVLQALHQAFPTNPEGNFSSDGYTISFRDHYKLLSEPYQLTLSGWNEDDTYPHTITFRFGLLPPYILEPWLALTQLTDWLKKLFLRRR